MTPTNSSEWEVLFNNAKQSEASTATLRLAEVAKQVHDNNMLQGGSAWLTSNHHWMRYLRAEAYELMDHYGTFKHWKAPLTDMAQAQMELVDILIFALSNEMANNRLLSACRAAGVALEDERAADHSGDTNTLIEDLVCTSFRGAVDWNTFSRLCSRLGMDYDRLIALFEGKNALNYIRATNGYKEGTYVKMWFGHEDNEVMRRAVLDSPTVMKKINSSGSALVQRNMRLFLQELYNRATNPEEPAAAANAC